MDKDKLGKLIGILRKEKYVLSKNKKWLQTNLCEGICSKATLVRIEAGKNSRYEEVYNQISHRLGYSYYSVDSFDQSIKVLEKELDEQIEFGYDQQIIETLEKMENILRIGKHMIYYQQQLEFVSILLTYYRDKEFKLVSRIETSIELLNVFSDTFASVCRSYLYLYMQHMMGDEDFKFYSNYLHLYKDKSFSTKICYFHLLFVNQSKRALNVFDELWEVCKQKKNIRRMGEMVSLLKLYTRHYHETLPIKYAKLTRLTFEHQSTMMLLNETVEKSFLNDIEGMKKVYSKLFDGNHKLPLFALIRYLLYTKDHRVESYIDKKEFCGRESHRLYFRYLKLNESEEIKHNYIMDTIYPRLKNANVLYIDYFTQQIFILCNVTKKYKDLYRMIKLS